MIDFQDLDILLRKQDNYVLTTHVNPDADAIGSVLTLQRILRIYNKNARIILCSEMPGYLRFLDTENIIEFYQPDKHNDVIINADTFVCLDFNRVDRMVSMAPLFPKLKGLKICIDHHQYPEEVFDYLFYDTDFCATGHILYEFIEQTNFAPMTLSLAEPLYAAIMTDTGSFRFERTTSRVHRIAAELLDAGVIPVKIHGEIFDQNSSAKMLLLGDALKSIEYFGRNDELGVMTITRENFRIYDSREDETEQFINLMMSAAKIQMGMNFIELPRGFKVSLRSKNILPVHHFAARFGGGGHRNAAGIRISDKSLAEMKDIIISDAIEFLKEQNNE